jgi:AAA15 family ATPase/GTPase
MSYIGRCQLSGYKSIKNVSCEFNKGLNIIIGNNGSGKTNLLEFIYKVLKRDYSKLDLFDAKISIISKSDIYRWHSEGIIPVNRVSEPGIQKIEINEPEKDIEVYVEFIRFSLPKEIPILSSEFNPKYNLDKGRLLINGAQEFMPFVFQFWLPSFFSSFLYGKKTRELKEADLYQALSDEILNGFLSTIRSQLILYTPIENVRFSDAIRITTIDASTLEFRNIVFEYQINQQWFSWDALSDGTKRLICLIFMMQGVEIEYSQDNKKGKIESYPLIFIEEPELGIHPHQLHLLMTLLKEKAEKQQIIITTHSPQVLDVLAEDKLDCVFITDIDFEKGTTIRKLTEKETEKAKLYLKDEGMLSDYWRFSDFQRSKDSK